MDMKATSATRATRRENGESGERGESGTSNVSDKSNESCLTQGYIAQWLERLTADQQVPGSNPGVPFQNWRRQKCTKKTIKHITFDYFPISFLRGFFDTLLAKEPPPPRELNERPSAYKTCALPLSYRSAAVSAQKRSVVNEHTAPPTRFLVALALQLRHLQKELKRKEKACTHFVRRRVRIIFDGKPTWPFV